MKKTYMAPRMEQIVMNDVQPLCASGVKAGGGVVDSGFGGVDTGRPAQEIDVEEYIGVKGFKARGKRLTTWVTEKIEELEPLRHAEEPEESTTEEEIDEEEKVIDPDEGKSQQQVIDEITGQLNLFTDEDL